MKKYLGILKQIGVVTGAIGTVWVIFTAWDALRDQGKQTQEMIVDVWEEVVIQQGEIEDINDTLKRLETHMGKQDAHMKDMENAAKFYLHNQKDLTEEAMEEAVEAILKKNNKTVLLNPN